MAQHFAKTIKAKLRAAIHPGLICVIDHPGAERYIEAIVSAKRQSSEGNGKLCAYLAAGLPVVAFDTAVNREIAGDAAVLVAPVSAAALCGGMENLLKPSAEQSTIRERARRRAIDHLSEDAVGEALVAIYAKVLRTL
jgi:glycosyltransferase involved in cell wall biosynthesis